MTNKQPHVKASETLPDVGNFAAFVLLTLLADTRVELGLDGDTSEIFERALSICGAFSAIGYRLRGAKMPFDEAASLAAREFRRQILAAEPVLARMAERGSLMPPPPAGGGSRPR